MRLTNKQRYLYERQEDEPIFMYWNPVTQQQNYGLARLGRSCVHITTSLRKLFLKGGILVTKETCDLDMHTIPVKRGNIIKILGEKNDK